jgi:hypothetical protein
MGVLDRDFMKDKDAANKPRWTDVAVPLDILKREERNQRLTALFWSLLVIGLLAAAVMSPQPKDALNCKAGELVVDTNRDGRFTYTDVGGLALQATGLPLKVARQRPELDPLITFLEIKPSDCGSPKAVILAGALLLALGVLMAWLVSVSLFMLRHAVKYVLFDLLKVSPFGRFNAIVFRYCYPRFVWLIPPTQVVLLCAGLTAVLLLKGNPSTITDARKPPARAAQTKPNNTTHATTGTQPYINLYQKHRIELSKLDSVVAAVPSAVATNVDTLTEFLVKDASSDLERAYVIYRWITANIDYDVQAFLTNNLRGIGSASAVLKNRKAVCDGYAELFLRMSMSAGLRAEKLVGFAKGYGYSIGESMKRPNHAWNAVQIDGRWYLLDSTWDAGSVDRESQGFKRNKAEYNFFLTNPSHFIYTHLPESSRWQLLENPWSADEFYAAVGATDKAFRMGLKVDQHAASTIRVTGNQYEFDFVTKNPLTAALRRDGKKVPGNWALAQFDEAGRTKLLVSAPDRGPHAITIFSSDQPQAAVFDSLLEYQIVFDAPGREFPEAFGRYLSSKTALKAPLTGTLKPNTPVAFDLTVPSAESVIVNVNGQTVLTLQREGQRFTGEATLSEGEVMVFAKFPLRDRLDGLIRYRVKL